MVYALIALAALAVGVVFCLDCVNLYLRENEIKVYRIGPS